MAKQYARTTKSKMFKSVPIAMVKAGKENNLIFTISTSTPDRDEDILEPKGCQLKNYKKNSVVLFAHDYHSLPVGKSVNIQALDNHIEAEVEFAPTQFAQEVRVLCEQGFLNAASVGFIPIESEPIESKDDDSGRLMSRGFRFKKWDLLEWSIVPVPSNFEALIQNAKAKGIGVEAMEQELITEEELEVEEFDPTKLVLIDRATGEIVKTEVELPEADITAFGDPERVLLNPSTGEIWTEPFEEEEENDELETADSLTIEDSESFKEIRLSSKMFEKLIVDGVPVTEKAGRVLSAPNEKRIKSARDSLTEVLDQLEEQGSDENDAGKSLDFEDMVMRFEEVLESVKRSFGEKTVVMKLDGAAPEEEKEEEESAGGEPYLELEIDEIDDDEIVFEMDELAEVIRSAIKPELSELKRGITGKIE